MFPLFSSYFMGGAFVRDLPQFRQQNFEPLWLKCPILGNHAILIPLLNYLNSKYQFTLLQPFLIMYNHSEFFCCPWRIKYGKASYINDVRFVWVLTTSFGIFKELHIIRCPGHRDKCACGSCHIWIVAIGVKCQNCCQTLDVYLLFAI